MNKLFRTLSALAILAAFILAACAPATEAMGEVMFGTPTISPTQVPAEPLVLVGVSPTSTPMTVHGSGTPALVQEIIFGPADIMMLPGSTISIGGIDQGYSLVADYMDANNGSCTVTLYSLDRSIVEPIDAVEAQTTRFAAVNITVKISGNMLEVHIPEGMTLVQ